MLIISGEMIMGVSSFQTTEYSVVCDICGKKEVCHSFYENVHNKQQTIKWAGMMKTKDGSILCKDCYKKNKMVGKMVACNNRNSEWCPYGTPNTKCDAHDPREKKFGEDMDFYCLIGTLNDYKHRKCKLVEFNE